MRSLLLCLLGVSICYAAETPQKFLEISAIPTMNASAGATGTLKIPISVGKEYHVHSNPAANRQYISTEVKFEATDKIAIGKASYPKGTPYRLKGSPTEISVYSGRFEILVPVTISSDALKGKAELKGTLRFQACNDQICFFPKNLPFTVPVQVQ